LKGFDPDRIGDNSRRIPGPRRLGCRTGDAASSRPSWSRRLAPSIQR
jgi:hypothetical protein